MIPGWPAIALAGTKTSDESTSAAQGSARACCAAAKHAIYGGYPRGRDLDRREASYAQALRRPINEPVGVRGPTL